MYNEWIVKQYKSIFNKCMEYNTPRHEASLVIKVFVNLTGTMHFVGDSNLPNNTVLIPTIVWHGSESNIQWQNTLHIRWKGFTSSKQGVLFTFFYHNSLYILQIACTAHSWKINIESISVYLHEIKITHDMTLWKLIK